MLLTKPRVQNGSKLQDFLKISSETQISMVFSKNQNTWIKNEFTSGWTFFAYFAQNTVFHAFDQNLIIKYQDDWVHGVRRWWNFQKCHFLDFPDFTRIHIFHKKCKTTYFLAKCKNARKCRKFTKNTVKILKKSPMLVENLLRRSLDEKVQAVRRWSNVRNWHFPKFHVFVENHKIITKLSFRDTFWKIPKDYSDQNNELLEYGSANSASVIQCLGIFTV